MKKAPVADLCDLVECGVRPNGEVRAGHVVGDGGGQHHLYSTVHISSVVSLCSTTCTVHLSLVVAQCSTNCTVQYILAQWYHYVAPPVQYILA